MFPKISGAWLSKKQLVYIITQVQDKFVWRVVHENGVVETGIGSITIGDIGNTDRVSLTVQWNNHGGNLSEKAQPPCGGFATFNKDRVINDISWDDLDPFSRLA